ncbi:MAG: hypothetical protein KJO07_06250 [Deltaproteobacteria bacterium]|nr:hypothetical protein [Deltaproteobacteria bacterium]
MTSFVARPGVGRLVALVAVLALWSIRSRLSMRLMALGRLDARELDLWLEILLLLSGPALLVVIIGVLADRLGPWLVLVIMAVPAAVLPAVLAATDLPGSLSLVVYLAADASGDGCQLWLFGALLVGLDLRSARWLLPLLAASIPGLALVADQLEIMSWGLAPSVALSTGVLVLAVLVARPLMIASKWDHRVAHNRGSYLLLVRNRYLFNLLLLSLAAALLGAAIFDLRPGAEFAAARLELDSPEAAFATTGSYLNISALATMAATATLFPVLLGRVRPIVLGGAFGGIAVVLGGATALAGGPLWLGALAHGLKGVVGYCLLAAWAQASSVAIFKGRMAVAFVVTLSVAVVSRLVTHGTEHGPWILLGLGAIGLVLPALGTARAPRTAEREAKAFD